MPLKQLLAQAEFSVSVTTPAGLPKDTGLEVAFAGRSNAGKSSALNVISGRRQLARTSRTPGRTRNINFFRVTEDTRLADLPGYGYARAGRKQQQNWTDLLEYYFRHRQSLRGVILVMDIRHPLKELDLVMLDWCIYYHYDVHILLNKADKLSRNQAARQLSLVKHNLPDCAQVSIDVQLFSALEHSGLEQAVQKLGNWLKLE